MSELIKCSNLTLGYDGKAVINNLNFSINDGEYLCIVGENGTGKSTLMKAILQLKKPMGGKILFDSKVLPNEIGYIPQQTQVQKDFPASVKEIVVSGCLNQSKWYPFYTKEQKQRAIKSMEQVGISSLAKRCYRELSGGQQQRVLLARALCASKKLLFLDEPGTGLDPQSTEELYRTLYNLNRKKEITIIMISHDLEVVRHYASHILCLTDKEFFCGTKEEYFNAMNSKEGKTYERNL